MNYAVFNQISPVVFQQYVSFVGVLGTIVGQFEMRFDIYVLDKSRSYFVSLWRIIAYTKT